MASVILVTGLSGAFVQLGQVKLTGMALGTCVGMLLGVIFWIIDKFHAANDYPDDNSSEDASQNVPVKN